VYDKVMAGVAASPAMRRALFHTAVSSKMWYLREGGHVAHPVYDALIFSKLRALMGGRVRLMVTGSAPIAARVKDFFQVAFCAPVLEGYGLSETVGLGTLAPMAARCAPGVGAAVTCTELKLADIPDMGYSHADKPYPRGEICLRGPNIFLGYFKAPEETAAAIDASGWFHTGDVGRLTPSGLVVIFDRKKNIFKLSQGEYVAAEKIENVYTRCPLVAQVFVYGDSLKSCLVGVVVPDPEVAAKWAADNKVHPFVGCCGWVLLSLLPQPHPTTTLHNAGGRQLCVRVCQPQLQGGGGGRHGGRGQGGGAEGVRVREGHPPGGKPVLGGEQPADAHLQAAPPAAARLLPPGGGRRAGLGWGGAGGYSLAGGPAGGRGGGGGAGAVSATGRGGGAC